MSFGLEYFRPALQWLTYPLPLLNSRPSSGTFGNQESPQAFEDFGTMVRMRSSELELESLMNALAT